MSPAEALVDVSVTVRFAHLRPGSYRLQVRRTGYRSNDPQSAWIEMGKPAALSAAQVRKLQSLTRDMPKRDARVRVARAGTYSLTLPMRTNDVVLVTMERVGR